MAVVSTSGNDFSSQNLRYVHEIAAQKKLKDAQELQAKGALQLLQSAAQVAPLPPATATSGNIINTRA